MEINIAEVERRWKELGGVDYELEKLREQLGHAACIQLGRIPLDLAAIAARANDNSITHKIETAAGSVTGRRTRVEFGEAPSVKRETKGYKKGDYSVVVLNETQIVLPPCGYVMNDPVRGFRAIIAKSIPMDLLEGAFRVNAIVQSRANSKTFVVRDFIYYARFLFSMETPIEKVETAAKTQNFALLNTRFEELEKAGLLA